MLLGAIWFGSLAVLVGCETFDLGDYDQYKASGGVDIAGGSVLLSRGESNALTIQLGSATQSKIESTLNDKCGELNNECFQSVYNVLNDAELEFDGHFEKRELVSLVSRTAGLVFAFLFGVASILIEGYMLFRDQPPMAFVRVPEAKASEASVFGSNHPVTVSAEGSAIVTVTPTPDPTSLQGHTEPTVVPITEAIEGYQPGDFMAKLDPDLASLIDEIMHRTHECHDGTIFDRSHPPSRKRDTGTLGNAICGAQGAAGMAQPGGPLNDILLMNGPTFHFRAEDYAAAAQQVVNFVRDYAPVLAVDPAIATEIGQILFILAVDTILNGLPLAAENPVKQDLVEEGEPDEQPTNTSTGCPRPTECVVNCDGVGDMFYLCETDCQTKTDQCASDKDKTMLVTTTATHEWDAYATAGIESGRDLQPQEPECEGQENLWSLAVKVFYDVNSDQNVVKHFCDEVSGSERQGVDWTVDSRGNKQSNQRKRAPSKNPDDYPNHRVLLRWEPKQGAETVSCPQSCMDVWHDIAQGPCGSGESLWMSTKGSQDLGCGTYSWEILDLARQSEEPEEAENDVPLIDPGYNPDCNPEEDLYQCESIWNHN